MKDFFQLIRRFALPYKWDVAWSIIFNFLAAFLTLFSFAFIIPILQMLFQMDTGTYSYMEWGEASMKDVIVNDFYYYTQEVIRTRGASLALALLALLLIVMTMFKTGTTYMSTFFLVKVRNGIVRDMRNQMYRKILTLPIGFFTNERKGDVMARISGDVTEVQTSVMASLDMLFKNPIMIVVCLVMMIVVSWELTLFVLILLPAAGYVMGVVGKKLKRKSLKAQQMWGTILATVEETLSGLRIIKAFNAEKNMDERFTAETQSYFNMSNGIERRTTLAHPMSEFLGTIAISIVLWFGGTLILSGRSNIDAAAFIYYMVIFYSIINPAKDLSKAIYSIRKGMASMGRIDMILGAQNPICDPDNPVSLPMSAEQSASIAFKNVEFSYIDGKKVIDNVSLEVPAGKTVAIVGQSGSGKSTLADLVPRFWDVDNGCVEVNGIDVRKLRVKDLRSLMGNVNQEAILFNDSFFNNIAFGSENATREQVEAAARIANAHDFIMETAEGYDTNIGDRGSKLSGGQRQRISIARAILKNPPILILDEATSALDTESERLVQEALERLMKNRTTLVIAHRLSTIVNADLICVMHEGQIVERGTHEELIKIDGYYKKLASMQQMDAE
jgi:ABC-type multidrug transport system fused ATPase/permease subunit